MTNPVLQNPGYTYLGVLNGIIGSQPVSGTCLITSGSATVSGMSFNPQTAGPGSGAFRKGSLIKLSAGGHAPDILATVATSASITLLTVVSATASGVAITMLNLPGLITGEASALTSGQTVTSNYFMGAAGVSGVTTQAEYTSAVYCDLVFIAGGAFTPTSGGYLAGWFLESEDGGVSFEKTVANTAAPRAPDFIVPLYLNAYAAGDRSWAKGVLLPSAPSKILLQNNANVTMPATWGIWALPEGVQLAT